MFSTKLQFLDWTQCYNDSILGSSGLRKCDTFKLWSVGLYPSKSYIRIPDSQSDGSWRYSVWVRWVVKVGSWCWNECLYQKDISLTCRAFFLRLTSFDMRGIYTLLLLSRWGVTYLLRWTAWYFGFWYWEVLRSFGRWDLVGGPWVIREWPRKRLWNADPSPTLLSWLMLWGSCSALHSPLFLSNALIRGLWQTGLTNPEIRSSEH